MEIICLVIGIIFGICISRFIFFKEDGTIGIDNSFEDGSKVILNCNLDKALHKKHIILKTFEKIEFNNLDQDSQELHD